MKGRKMSYEKIILDLKNEIKKYNGGSSHD